MAPLSGRAAGSATVARSRAGASQSPPRAPGLGVGAAPGNAAVSIPHLPPACSGVARRSLAQEPGRRRRRADLARRPAVSTTDAMTVPGNAPNSLSLAFAEGLYAEFLRDPASVDAEWRAYFEGLGAEDAAFAASGQLGPSFTAGSVFDPPSAHVRSEARTLPELLVAPAVPGPAAAALLERGGPRSFRPTRPALGRVEPEDGVSDDVRRQDRVDQLVRAFRVRGHLIAKLDPLGLPRPAQPELRPEFHGLGAEDLPRRFSSRTIHGRETLTLAELLEHLYAAYCGSVGVQFMHIDDLDMKNWIQERVEGAHSLALNTEQQRRILTKLTDAVIFEEFIQKKYLGAKSFSLEGSESLVPLLDFAIDRAADHGVREIVLGMPHRGRLSVLATIMGKSPREIFREFEDADPELYKGSGDVKYHLGYSTDFLSSNGEKVHLSLCFNPSHLEFVDPVVLGRVRAKQDRTGDAARKAVLGIVIHGDAAFAGQGMIQETLNLSQLRAYTTGGTIHIVVNNQIGFTTSPGESRSMTYATDVAKMLQSPIFHVNGEDPDAVARVICTAMDFRDRFQRDVVIDMWGYRRHGHNEGDEPEFTQPVLYRAISKRKSVRDGYLENLLRLGDVTREEADRITVERREHLEQELAEARRPDYVKTFNWLGGYWEGYVGGTESSVKEVETGLALDVARGALGKLTELPEGFHPHRKVERLLEQRREMAEGKRPLDWGTGELLAFASLSLDGFRVRMTGQDSARGTFSSRHAVLHDYEDGHTCMPLGRLSPTQGPVEICNSPLSEAAVLGFEYGFSLDCPDGLVVWEAQFGDFANGAQVIIDQFIASAEDKWRRLSGLVLMLPHAFEGMGPEHSSARLERFLTLAAQENIQIVQATTPAQHFHVLRRQVLRRWRKPLVLFTPKSLLRLPEATSALSEFTTGRFQRVIPDVSGSAGKDVTRVLLCSGRVYYDLERHRRELQRSDVALLRLEQFYPLPDDCLRSALAPYRDGTPVMWVQDEPANMGAWQHLRARFGERLFGRLPFSGVSRDASASPATGSGSCHKLEQRELLERAFGGV